MKTDRIDANVVSSESEPEGNLSEAGKIGKALVLWMLGVPGGLILLYLLFAHS